jgi:hypothetical protein
MVVMEWIVAATVLLVALLTAIVVSSYLFGGGHEVYDTGDGIKVRCPEGDGMSRVVYGSTVFCPFCSLKLKPPKHKYRWERR